MAFAVDAANQDEVLFNGNIQVTRVLLRVGLCYVQARWAVGSPAGFYICDLLNYYRFYRLPLVQ